MNDGMAPLDVVVKILNNQLSSLMWIDEKVSILLRKLFDLQFVVFIDSMQLNVSELSAPMSGESQNLCNIISLPFFLCAYFYYYLVKNL